MNSLYIFFLLVYYFTCVVLNKKVQYSVIIQSASISTAPLRIVRESLIIKELLVTSRYSAVMAAAAMLIGSATVGGPPDHVGYVPVRPAKYL